MERKQEVAVLLANEAFKLRTVRTWWWLLAAAQAIVVIGVSGRIIGATKLDDPALGSEAAAHVGLVSVLTVILGILAVAGEYRHRTIVDTYLGTPSRGQVITAKLIVYTAAGVAFGVISSITCLVTAMISMAGKGASFDLSDSAMWATLFGSVLWNAAFAAIGVAIGALVRNLAGAIAAALAWVALIEGLVGQLVGSTVGQWLPFAAGTRLARLPAATEGLTQWAAGLVLVGYAVLIAAVALFTSVRRDVA